MAKWVIAAWLAIGVPLVVAVLSGGPEAPWGHALFHVGYALFAIAAVGAVWQLRSATSDRWVRRAALGVAIAQSVFIVGQLTELASVLALGGEAALLDPNHELAALATTAPGLLLSWAGLPVLTVLAVTARRRITGHATHAGSSER